jgi:hypothetical protein
MEPDTRVDLETAISRWRAAGDLDADTLAELEAHLRDASAEGIERGLAPAEAFRAALMRLGDPAQLSAEFSKNQQHRSPSTMNISTLIHSPRLRRYARQLAIGLFIVIPLRVFAVIPYRAPGSSVAPEIPAGSHLIVWQLAPTFAPGDIAAYRNGAKVYLGRVSAVSDSDLSIARNGTPVQSIPRSAVIGRVVLSTH